MKKLIAKRDILFSGKMYKAGEELPTNDPQMVELWTKYNSATWKGDNITGGGDNLPPKEEPENTGEHDDKEESENAGEPKPKIRGRNKR